MKVLVTGGNGFVGSNLVDRLINLGHEVVVIDNLSADTHEQFYYNDRAVYHRLDIADYESTRDLYQGVNVVFHCAAEARIQPSLINPIQVIKTNVLGTEVVLQCSREAGVDRVINSSTSSSYGLKNTPPLVETMITDCLTPYSVSKVAGEELCKLYTRLFGLKTVTLRYFNVYGYREPTKGSYATVVGLFLKQQKNNEPLSIVPDGQQRRDFTNIVDVVEANIAAMTTEHDHWGEAFNVGTGKNYSIKELADLISSNQMFVNPRKAESRETLADNTKMREVMKWIPTVDIKDYIKQQLNK
jgi:UDP-glucose 4-epimerase